MSDLRYNISKRIAPNHSEYFKVFLMDNSEINTIRELLLGLQTIKNVNITKSTSADPCDQTLTVYPKSMCKADEVEVDIKKALDNYQSNVRVGHLQADSSAHFSEIESQILKELNDAKATIDVCVAWFTNDKLRNLLFEKKNNGIKVRVITFKDGVNKTYGVDLSPFEHIEIKGERGGLMHDKFCIVDNVTTITGSYNWSNNAEFKNDENIAIEKENVKFASSYTRKFNEMWSR